MISNPYFFELALPGGVEHEDQKVNYSFLSLQYRIKAISGSAEAQHALAVLYYLAEGVNKDDQKAFELWSKAASQNHLPSLYNLSISYKEGIGCAKNMQKHIDNMLKAANLNFAKAQYDLGFMYTYGKGVSQDYKKAAEWYKPLCKDMQTRNIVWDICTKQDKE